MAEHDDDNHGNSLAAWVMVGVVLLGSAVASLAFILPSVGVGIAGVVIILGGLIAGKVLSLAGYGVNGAPVRREVDLP